MDKRFTLIVSLVVVALFGLLMISGGKQSSSDVTFEGDATTINETDKVKGAVGEDASPTVEIIEYADFSCPACGAFYPVIDQLVADYGDNLVFAFRHFPLDQIHPNAVAAHRAAEAAAMQGKFFEMHDILYANQNAWTAQASGISVSQAIETFRGYAAQIGLDMEKYTTDSQSQEAFNQIDLDLQSGKQLGVTGTPSLFLNGEKIDNPRSYEELAALVEQAIEDAKAGDSSETDAN